MQNMPDRLPQPELILPGYEATGAPDSAVNPRPHGGGGCIPFGCTRLSVIVLLALLLVCCCCGLVVALGALDRDDKSDQRDLPERHRNTSALYHELEPVVQWMPAGHGDFVLILPEQ